MILGSFFLTYNIVLYERLVLLSEGFRLTIAPLQLKVVHLWPKTPLRKCVWRTEWITYTLWARPPTWHTLIITFYFYIITDLPCWSFSFFDCLLSLNCEPLQSFLKSSTWCYFETNTLKMKINVFMGSQVTLGLRRCLSWPGTFVAWLLPISLNHLISCYLSIVIYLIKG